MRSVHCVHWVHWVHAGLLGDDWEAEHAAMSEGDSMHFYKLGEYPTWEVVREPLHLDGLVQLDDKVRLTPDGLDPIEGVVDCVSNSFFGVRTDDAMYRFLRGFEGSVLVGHHLFADDRHVSNRSCLEKLAHGRVGAFYLMASPSVGEPDTLTSLACLPTVPDLVCPRGHSLPPIASASRPC